MEEDELADYFNDAAEARQQDPQVSPGISAAHEHDPSGLDGTSLGNAPLATREFNESANDPVNRDFEDEQPEAVPEHAPAPDLVMRPPNDISRAADEVAFEERQVAVDNAIQNDDFYDQAYEDLENGQDGIENDNVNDGKENGGLDDGMDQN